VDGIPGEGQEAGKLSFPVDGIPGEGQKPENSHSRWMGFRVKVIWGTRNVESLIDLNQRDALPIEGTLSVDRSMRRLVWCA
jgi:hypothetical protein